jgi:hypothetical protein
VRSAVTCLENSKKTRRRAPRSASRPAPSLGPESGLKKTQCELIERIDNDTGGDYLVHVHVGAACKNEITIWRAKTENNDNSLNSPRTSAYSREEMPAAWRICRKALGATSTNFTFFLLLPLASTLDASSTCIVTWAPH